MSLLLSQLGAGGDASAAITGVAGAGAAGTVSLAISVTLGGVAGTGSAGSVAASVAAFVGGVAGAGEVGVVDKAVALVLGGVGGTGFAGDVTLDGVIVVPPSSGGGGFIISKDGLRRDRKRKQLASLGFEVPESLRPFIAGYQAVAEAGAERKELRAAVRESGQDAPSTRLPVARQVAAIDWEQFARSVRAGRELLAALDRVARRIEEDAERARMVELAQRLEAAIEDAEAQDEEDAMIALLLH